MLRIGLNIKRLREVKGWKQEDLARSVGISQSEISRLEGKDDVEEEILAKIAEALEFPIDAFKMENLDATISMVIQQSSSQGYIFNYTPVDKVIELYERWLAEKNAEISALKAINETLRQRLSNG